MGLKSAKIAMIDQLFACSKPADWQGVAPPIVWPSNARLARGMGVSVSTMKHHLNGLVRAGLVAYRDGSTYQRSGRRDADGNIVEAAGIDLSPIAVRFEELTALVDEAELAAKQAQQLAHRRTVLRKQVKAVIDAAARDGLSGAWPSLTERLEAMNAMRASDNIARSELIGGYEVLLLEVEAAYDMAYREANPVSAVSKNDPLTSLQTSEPDSGNPPPTGVSARGIGRTGSFGASNDARPPVLPFKISVPSDLQRISLELVARACPSYGHMAPGALASWKTFKQAAPEVAAALEIDRETWDRSVATLGWELAATALAVTSEKARSGKVFRPTAYLRSLARRGEHGELHLSRSLFGLLETRIAPDIRAARADLPAAEAFPETGSIYFTNWAEKVRRHAPGPTPDVDLVADAFRRWARSKDIRLDAPGIDKVMIGFCRKWRFGTF
ncbi:hypothetical protein A3840_15875 [Devosia elaeis]|uniref:Uncharacterized protein n=2 Tax=Devosia elaeis TaxID=1770058 RepID=A0A178HNW1_9HYPH|nr:hypothetical protein A3840_15875 [Devosia elaeis]